MLMPILTVKTAAIAAQAAAAIETVTPRERGLPIPVRISGSQSEAALKILEALNRHLVGSEPLPKEALIRLLDTLAKILKFPPLPQETLRDFTKRLAVFLETLPPAARLALEKQLGQRNLAATVRILIEAVKNPSIIDAPRLLEKLFTPPTAPRTVIGQQDARPLPVLPPPHGQAAVPSRQTPLPIMQALIAAPALVPDAGLLQAALKKAFGDEDEIAQPLLSTEENEAEQGVVAGSRRDDPPARATTVRGSDTAAASSQPRQPAKANSETIPLLRAAAAFLAADPEALSLVAAIATGDIDSRIRGALEQELGLDLPEQMEPLDKPEQPTQSESQKPAGHPAAANKPEPDIRESHRETASAGSRPFLENRLPLQEADAATAGVPSTEPDVEINVNPASVRTPLVRTIGEVEGFKGHDLGEWELEAEPNHQSLSSTEEIQPDILEPDLERPQETLVQTLKALVEAGLPLPEGGAEEPGTLFSALAGETADIGAEILFAEIEGDGDAALRPDMSVLTGDIGETAEPFGFEADSWNTMLDGPEEGNANRQTFAHPSTVEENTREALTPRLTDAGIARDAIPFAMIPYLPAKTQDIRAAKVEDEEQPGFADDEQDNQHRQSHDQSEDRENGAAASQTEVEEDESGNADAYDLYRRMGGLG